MANVILEMQREAIYDLMNFLEFGTIITPYTQFSLEPKSEQGVIDLLYGRGNFSLIDGDIRKVLNGYVKFGGRYAQEVSRMVSAGKDLSDRESLIMLLKKIGKEDKMVLAQDTVYELWINSPVIKWLTSNNIEYPLSILATLNARFITGSTTLIPKMFKGKTPAKGGDEFKYITSYILRTKQWLQENKNPFAKDKIWRTDFLMYQIRERNWMLMHLPININGFEYMGRMKI